MSSDDRMTRSIADEIERYLQRHPGAADTAEGIRAWWLPVDLSGIDLSVVVAALEQLEARGVVMRTELKGLQTTFGSAARGRKSMQ